jgi:hypothetical protein
MSGEGRVYQMTRVRSGDYLVPSNDATQLWRISRYEEDGSLYYPGDDRQVRGTFWRVARFRGSLEGAAALLERDVDEFLDWDQWSEWASLQPTRAAALEAAGIA